MDLKIKFLTIFASEGPVTAHEGCTTKTRPNYASATKTLRRYKYKRVRGAAVLLSFVSFVFSVCAVRFFYWWWVPLPSHHKLRTTILMIYLPNKALMHMKLCQKSTPALDTARQAPTGKHLSQKLKECIPDAWQRC